MKKTKKIHIKDFEKEARRKSEVTKGAFHLTKTFENGKWYRNFPERFPEIPCTPSCFKAICSQLNDSKFTL